MPTDHTAAALLSAAEKKAAAPKKAPAKKPAAKADKKGEGEAATLLVFPCF